jgi:Domain of unknown function (DUF1844)
MAERREGFTVTDRRLFTPDGELRQESTEETPAAATRASESKAATAQAQTPAPAAAQASAVPAEPEESEAPPSAAEQQAGADAYKQSSRHLDSQVELSGHSAKDLEMTFERFMASLYMTAMLQLGLMREQNANPTVDLIGARQTIDTLSIIAEKTKGNLTPAESNFLQNCLYELRMAYVEVTNALSRPPQAGDPKVKTH